MIELGFTEEQEKVSEMMEMMGQSQRRYPGIPTILDQSLSIELIIEETRELIEAIIKEDIIGVADGLGDLLVVVYGAANRFGIPMKPVFDEIHRSNMTKVWPENTPKYMKYSKSGKYLKPDTYSPPDLFKVLEHYSDWKEENS